MAPTELSSRPERSVVEGPAVLYTGNKGCVPHLPRFPVEACGVDTLHAPFLNERRTRGSLWHSVTGNRGQAGVWLEWDTTALDERFLVAYADFPGNAARWLGSQRYQKQGKPW
jgi:hypothetical protein